MPLRAQVGHWDASIFNGSQVGAIDGWQNNANGRFSLTSSTFGSDRPLLEKGGIKFDDTRIELLSAAEANAIFDFSAADGPNDRKAGRGMSLFLAFRTPETMGRGMRYLLANGDGDNGTDRGVSLAIGVNQFFNFSVGDGKALFDGQAVMQGGQTYVVAVNYNALTQKLEMYNTLSKQFVSNTTPAANYGKNLPLLLGGLHKSSQYAAGTYYELKLYDRAISAQQMSEEAERLQIKWQSRASLVQHLDAGVVTSIEKSGAAVQSWKDQSGNQRDALNEKDYFFHSEGIAGTEKAPGVFALGHSASMTLQDRAMQRGWLDYSAGGEAADHSGFTVVSTFRPSGFHEAWNDFLGHDKLMMLVTNEGLTGVQVNGVSLGRSYQIGRHEVVTYTMRYDAQNEELEFWNSGNGAVLRKPLPRADFSSDTPLRLGFARAASQYFKGDLFEIKIFDSKLSDETLALEQDQQAKKWGPTVLPVEVLGVEGTTEEAYFYLDRDQLRVASEVWLQVNSLVYENKGSVQINDGAWTTLNQETVTLHKQEAARGGMTHGGFNTIRFHWPVDTFQAGLNTIKFRFNESDGLSIGYRVINLQILSAAGENLLTDGQTTLDEPNEWSTPYTDTTSVTQGEMLWRGVTSLPASDLNKGGPGARLWNHYKEESVEGFWHGYALPVRKTMRASCTDCHTQDGRDLELFSYSNKSIVERSKFHGLTENEGLKIASYIRTLSAKHSNLERAGRPWNPPYQPGPKVGEMAIHNWAAGAGLGAVLEDDSEMVPYLFGTAPGQNPSLTQVKAFFDTEGGYDSSILPLSLQLPDWKHWLPMVHPLDAFNANADGSDVWYSGLKGDTSSASSHPREAIVGFRTFLEEMASAPQGRVAFLDQNGRGNLRELTNLSQRITSRFRSWWAVSATLESHWRSTGGVATRLLKPEVPREWASSSLAKVQAVKQFEHFNEFSLQDMQFEMASVEERERLHIPRRHWLTSGSYHVYPTAPHFVAAGQRGLLYRGTEIPSSSSRFLGQSAASGRYESTSWYELQAIITPGYMAESNVAGPVHYNYQMPLIVEASRDAEIYEGLRYFHTANRMYQTMLGGRQGGRTFGWKGSLAVSDADFLDQGFELRTMAPFYLFDLDRKLIESADSVYPDLGAKIAAAHIEQFVNEMEKTNDAGNPLYDLDEWPRSNADYSLPLGQEKNYTLDYKEKDFYSPTPHFSSWADKFYADLLTGIDAGVDVNALARLKNWCQRAWPRMPWNELPLGDRAKIVRAEVPAEMIRNSEGETRFQIENVGTNTWSASKGYRVGISRTEALAFSEQNSGNGLSVQAGSRFLVAWNLHDNLSRSHWFTLPLRTQPIKFSLLLGNFTNDERFKAPAAVELYRDGVLLGTLTGTTPAPGSFEEWSYILSTNASEGHFEVRVTMDESEGNMAFDHFVVNQVSNGEVLYEELVESSENWEVTSGNENWGLTYHELPAGREIRPGERYEFSLPLSAPEYEGVEDLNIRMLNLGAGWFGQLRINNIQVISYLNAWEGAYGIGQVNDPNRDTDGDGRSDLKEYIDGSDPTVKDSNPSPLTILKNGGNNFRLQFKKRQDRDIRYVLMESGEDLRFMRSSFQPAELSVDDGVQVDDILSLTRSHKRRFYRLDAELITN